MVAAIRIKLVDLLKILSIHPPSVWASARTDPKQRTLFESAMTTAETEADVECIKRYLLLSGSARRREVEMELNLSGKAVLRRLNLLRERGELVDLPDHVYGLKEKIQ
jgi:hypothetical protein